MGTEIEARDIAPSVIKWEMQAHQITHQLPIPIQTRQPSTKYPQKRVACPAKEGKDTGRGEEKGKGLTPPASKFVPRILLIVSNRGKGQNP